jgi:hypothetical protein
MWIDECVCVTEKKRWWRRKTRLCRAVKLQIVERGCSPKLDNF